MKRIIQYPYIFLLSFLGIACSKFDNYPEPQETLQGNITDLLTGAPIQTEAGNGGIRIKLEELSWSDNPTPYYFFTMQDGTFNNNKIFKGQYRISVEGPFVPLIQNDASGKVVVDNSQTTDITGIKQVDFKVEPFLLVEWVGEPTYNATDQTITAQVKFTRGTANTDFHQNVSDVFLFVNALPYVGNNNYDNRYSAQVVYNGSEGDEQLGETVTITTKDKLAGARTYYLRIGARTNYGLKYYNYTTIKTITLP